MFVKSIWSAILSSAYELFIEFSNYKEILQWKSDQKNEKYIIGCHSVGIGVWDSLLQPKSNNTRVGVITGNKLIKSSDLSKKYYNVLTVILSV